MVTHSGVIARMINRLSGLSYQTIFLIWTGMIFVFAFIYAGLSYLPGEGLVGVAGAFDARFFGSLYFSIITATTTGYGDIHPIGLARLFAVIEAFGGLFLFGVFISKMMSHRQELALRDVHRISFENTFHNIREDLHAVRADFDRVLRTVRSGQRLSEDEWERLEVAYEQIANLISEVPHFYGGANHLYVIDERREDLLVEAIHRTLKRVNELLETLSGANIVWIEREASVARLREVVQLVRSVVPPWRDHSPYRTTADFEQLLTLVDSINARVEKALPL